MIRWVPLVIGIVLIFFQYKLNVDMDETIERHKIMGIESPIRKESFTRDLFSDRPFAEVLGYHLGKNFMGLIGLLFAFGSIRAIYIADKRASESMKHKINRELDKAEKEIRMNSSNEYNNQIDMTPISIDELSKMAEEETEALNDKEDKEHGSSDYTDHDPLQENEDSDAKLRRYIRELKTRRGDEMADDGTK